VVEALNTMRLGLWLAGGLLLAGPGLLPAAAGPLTDSDAILSFCVAGPVADGTAQCQFSCPGSSAGSHGTGVGEITMECGKSRCVADVPDTSGCDLLGLRSGSAGTCTFAGTGFAVCESA
jgi:hypothetical protein